VAGPSRLLSDYRLSWYCTVPSYYYIDYLPVGVSTINLVERPAGSDRLFNVEDPIQSPFGSIFPLELYCYDEFFSHLRRTCLAFGLVDILHHF
jgi:hypothetical protein